MEFELSVHDPCPRCGIETSSVYLKNFGQCARCNAWDKERRDAWVQFAAYSVVLDEDDEDSAKAAAKVADCFLVQFDKRFPCPEKKS